MKTIRFDATPRTLEGLRRACASVDVRPAPSVALRFYCTSCGDRFYGTKLTARLCPSCESHEVIEQEREAV